MTANTTADTNSFEQSDIYIDIDDYLNWGIPIKKLHKYPYSKNDWITVPAGYISSSCNDLGKYLQMYLNNGGGVISKESVNTMLYGDTVYMLKAISRFGTDMVGYSKRAPIRAGASSQRT